MNMCMYHAITKSNALPLDNKETPSIVKLLHRFLPIIMINIFQLDAA